MSRQIDPDRIESGDLTADEILYLQDRGQLPEHVKPLDVRYYSGEGALDADGGAIEAEEVEQEPESSEDDEGTQEETPDGVEYRLAEGDTEDYDEGWTNVQRRAELSQRGLSADGKKEDLIARLLRSDAGETTEEDKAPESEED